MTEKKALKNKNIFSCVFAHWEMLLWLFGFIAYLLYVFYMYVEAPIESFISKFYLINLFYSGHIQLKDLLIPYTENGMLASNVFFLFNLKFFRFSVLIESLMNAILVAFVGYIALFGFSKLLVEKKTGFYYFSIVIMSAFLFTFMQQGGGGMSLQVRFGYAAFVLVTYMLDKVMHDNCGILYYILTIIMIFLSLDFFGSAYSFAAIPFICLLIFFLIIKQRKIELKNIGIMAAYICSGILYFIEYGFFTNAGQSTAAVGGGLFVKLGLFLSNIRDVFIGFVFWCASAVLGRASLEEGRITPTLYLMVGCIILFLIILAGYLYFKTRMYEMTYMPIFWFGYFFTLYFIISAGRLEVIEELGVAWVTSSWYTVHTKLIPVAIVGIYVYALNNSESKWSVTNISMYIGSIVMFICLAFGTFCCAIRLPSEKIWMQNRQTYFYVESIDELPEDDNGMTPLLQDRDTSWFAINILKKYHLSLFRD